MTTPGVLYQAPNSERAFRAGHPTEKTEAGLLPLAQPQRKGGVCGGPWGGLRGGKEGKEG